MVVWLSDLRAGLPLPPKKHSWYSYLLEAESNPGLLAGKAEDLIEAGAYRRFYMHRTGHWLGMDVHDVGQYKVDGQWRALAPGMTLTVEPGCYIRAADDVPEAFWNIGIRVEDNALVTAEGCEYLTDGVPREIADIEALMRE